ncbi:PREDICTED: eukaryotic translation initiation factor 1A, X-chromosomal [Chaetura pelagica]|uniref:eukaryotic translation initiation factor 1A, X-chromosomal n=1 Tax=Chaetura pelagica TaxID=8897 RepID=UPI000523D8AB|nr:PREDICTED: eukaryotic translation initiation factor 1A, X-chromosomal [Chaetura pelagica]
MCLNCSVSNVPRDLEVARSILFSLATRKRRTTVQSFPQNHRNTDREYPKASGYHGKADQTQTVTDSNICSFFPCNLGKGGKNRRRGKNENESEKRELVFKEDGQEYAQVIKMLGNGRLEALCFDGVKRLCHIRGKLRKKVWINTSDIILVGLRDYQDNKADVILKYNADEARSLKAYGELPEHAKINETDTFGPGDDDEIQFDDIGDDDEDIDDI